MEAERSRPPDGTLTTRLYRIWKQFIEGKPAACAEWRHNASAFIAWAQAHGYQDDKLLLRFHGSGEYTPDNCFWSKKSGQYATKRFITAGGITQSMTEWARDTGIPYETIRGRIAAGNTPEQAVGLEPVPRGRKKKS